MDSVRYPVGPFDYDTVGAVSATDRVTLLRQIAELPQEMTRAVEDVTVAALTHRYRPGGWTLRQVVHHVADSHLNGYIRFRLALTEDTPVVKPYDEAAWAELPDVSRAPLADSLALLSGTHARWVQLLWAMTPDDYARDFYHPGARRVLRLDTALAMYAWHGRHHVAHVLAARERALTA